MNSAEALKTPPDQMLEPAHQRAVMGAGAWLVSSFVALSLANYIFSLAMSRRLSIGDYGSFGIASSILLLEGLVASAGFPWMLSTLVSRNEGAERRTVRAQALAIALIGNVTLGVLTASMVAMASAGLIAHHPLIPVLLALTAFATCINAVWYGLYQGERRFPLLASLRSGEAVTKVVIGTGLVMAGFGLNGAVGGSAIAAVCMVVWGATRVRAFAWPRQRRSFHIRVAQALGWTAVSLFGLALLMNMDIVAVRALGVGATASAGAGYYQAAAVLARAPVFVGLAVVNAVFPFLARGAVEPGQERNLLSLTVRVLTLGPLPVAVVLSAAPSQAIAFFFPPSYAPAIRLLQLTAIAAFPLVTLATVVTCLQATDGMRRAAIAVVPAVVIEAVCLVVLVPRIGALGAACAALVAASVGGGVSLAVMPRRWVSPALSRLGPVVVGWIVLAVAVMMVPMTPRLWIPETVLLYALFLLVVWALGGFSLAELLPIVPGCARATAGKMAACEGRWRGK
jgi:O-antigen/teichoic acid export membrane protein